MMATRDTNELPSIRFNNFYDFFTVQGWPHLIDTNIIYRQRYKSNNKERCRGRKLTCLCAIVLTLNWLSGFRVNLTPSLPLGLYRQGGGIERGGAVSFCLESREYIDLAKTRGYVGPGFCPGGLRPLGKEVYGLPGDLIGIEADGTISINREVLAGSAARTQDSRGRAMPTSRLRPGVIPPGRALLLSLHHTGSFDGRYFGLVDLAGCRKLQPVWVPGGWVATSVGNWCSPGFSSKLMMAEGLGYASLTDIE